MGRQSQGGGSALQLHTNTKGQEPKPTPQAPNGRSVCRWSARRTQARSNRRERDHVPFPFNPIPIPISIQRPEHDPRSLPSNRPEPPTCASRSPPIVSCKGPACRPPPYELLASPPPKRPLPSRLAHVAVGMARPVVSPARTSPLPEAFLDRHGHSSERDHTHSRGARPTVCAQAPATYAHGGATAARAGSVLGLVTQYAHAGRRACPASDRPEVGLARSLARSDKRTKAPLEAITRGGKGSFGVFLLHTLASRAASHPRISRSGVTRPALCTEMAPAGRARSDATSSRASLDLPLRFHYTSLPVRISLRFWLYVHVLNRGSARHVCRPCHTDPLVPSLARSRAPPH
jgi:hypothetical protein